MNTILRVTRFGTFVFLILAPAALLAQDETVGTLLVAHGSTKAWNDQVREVANLADTGGPLEITFLMGSEAEANPFQTAVRRLEDAGAEEIVVVSLLVSTNSQHYQQIRYLVGDEDHEMGEHMLHHLHDRGIARAETATPIRLAPSLDDSPELAEVLVDRALALAADPGEQALFLIGHGPNSAEDDAGWMENLRPISEAVRSQADFRDVKVGTVRQDAPESVRAEAVRRIRELIELQHAATGRDVVVVPFVMARGRLSEESLPADLEGLPVVYSSDALLPHPAMARWIERRVTEAATDRAAVR